MTAEVFIDKTEGDGVEISVVKHGQSAGAAHRYDTVDKARAVLLKFGFVPELIDRQLRTLFPEAEIADEVLRSLEFTAAIFQAA